MALSKENPCICIQCEGVVRFCTSNENEKRRHVAIFHGKETFSRLRCGKCERKYFDFDHFAEHLETSQECHKDSWIKPEPLSAHLEISFAALVEQMMLPVETDQMEKVPISGGNGEGKMDRTSGETWKRSMDGAKRKRTESVGGITPNSVKRQASGATRAMKTIRAGKRKKNKKANINTGRVRKAGTGKGQQWSNDTDGSDGRGTGKVMAAVGHASSIYEQSSIRREYCLELIDKFSTAGKLQCQLCSANCAVGRGSGTNPRRATYAAIEHAFGHLKMPFYHCRVCNVTKSTTGAIQYHIRGKHPGSEDDYEDCSEQYHKEIVDTLRLCFHVDKNKRAVEQVEKKLAIRGRFYNDTKSPLHNERLHYIRSLAAPYSNKSRLACQLCSKMCTVNKSMALMAIRNHIMVHLNKNIFQCKLCGHSMKTLFQLMNHIKHRHQQSMQGAYMDHSDKYHQDFMNMIGKCFDPDSGKEGAKSKKKAGSGISEGKRKTPTSGSSSTTSTVLTPADEKCFQCPHCQFWTKYEILMKKHSKVFHGH